MGIQDRAKNGLYVARIEKKNMDNTIEGVDKFEAFLDYLTSHGRRVLFEPTRSTRPDRGESGITVTHDVYHFRASTIRISTWEMRPSVGDLELELTSPKPLDRIITELYTVAPWLKE